MSDLPTRAAPVEYTPAAIDERFRQLEAIRKLPVSLRDAGEAARKQGAVTDDAVSSVRSNDSCLSGNATDHEQR